jgi:drug/metabolite transporter (DMT)-like permease
VLLGLVAAICWGSADILGAVVSRRIGSFASVVIGQTAGFGAVALVVLLSDPPMPEPRAVLLWLPISGIAVAVAYLAFYRGLQLGPVALVSPIGAGYGAVSVTLAVLVLGERLGAWPAVGVAAALVGIVLTARHPASLALEGVGREGVPYAIVAMIGFGVSAFVVGSYAQELGWSVAVLIARIGTIGTLLVLAVRARRRSRHAGVEADPRPPADVAFAIAVGTIDVAALSAFARASELGLVSIAAAVSATYPVIAILAGVARFQERLAVSQWLGIVLVIAGLVLLGATS